ncbi:hypothetical protein ACMBCN_01235, partial [Candidatus Liberibacter asiaticus]|nr:hypothetical protein [Candidatus Liberibacter asiaticus]
AGIFGANIYSPKNLGVKFFFLLKKTHKIVLSKLIVIKIAILIFKSYIFTIKNHFSLKVHPIKYR